MANIAASAGFAYEAWLRPRNFWRRSRIVTRRYGKERAGRQRSVATVKERSTVPSGEVIRVVCEVFGIERGELLRRRGGAPYRGMAVRMLVQQGGFPRRDRRLLSERW